MMEKVYASLKESGQLDNTYVFLTSDHGINLGEHRRPGKGSYFEQDIRVPLLVASPGPDVTKPRKQMILNTDFAPTFLDLAGADASSSEAMDGTSFVPLLRDGADDAPWRKRILVEYEKVHREPEYDVLRSETTKWVQLPGSGERELYRLERDPFELDSRHRREASKSWRRSLNDKLNALENCSGEECREAEGFPEP